jgi:hypothetical protein
MLIPLPGLSLTAQGHLEPGSTYCRDIYRMVGKLNKYSTSSYPVFIQQAGQTNVTNMR